MSHSRDPYAYISTSKYISKCMCEIHNILLKFAYANQVGVFMALRAHSLQHKVHFYPDIATGFQISIYCHMVSTKTYTCITRYARVCSKYGDFLFRVLVSILVSKLLKQRYSSRKLQTTFRKFYGRHTDLVHKFDTSVSHMLNGLLTNCDIWLVSSYL